MADLMKGKRGVIMGVANDHSIAWGIARALHGAGAQLAFTHQGEAFGRAAEPWEVASTIAFLASDDAAAVHGAVYRVDNGKGAG